MAKTALVVSVSGQIGYAAVEDAFLAERGL